MQMITCTQEQARHDNAPAATGSTVDGDVEAQERTSPRPNPVPISTSVPMDEDDDDNVYIPAAGSTSGLRERGGLRKYRLFTVVRGSLLVQGVSQVRRQRLLRGRLLIESNPRVLERRTASRLECVPRGNHEVRPHKGSDQALDEKRRLAPRGCTAAKTTKMDVSEAHCIGFLDGSNNINIPTHRSTTVLTSACPPLASPADS